MEGSRFDTREVKFDIYIILPATLGPSSRSFLHQLGNDKEVLQQHQLPFINILKNTSNR
jgi:hypothetical protein